MGDGTIHAKLWLLLAIGGAIFMVAMAVRHRRGRRRRSATGAILVALAMFAILAAAVLRRGPSPRMDITIDGNTRNHVVMPPFFSRLGIEEYIDEFRQNMAELKADTKQFAAGIRDEAQEEFEEARENFAVDVEGRNYIAIPPTSGNPVLSFQWDHPSAAPRAERAVPAPHHGRAPPSSIPRGTPLWNLLAGLALVAFLFVGYVFLDAATRGQFTGQLRFLSIVAILVAILASISSV